MTLWTDLIDYTAESIPSQASLNEIVQDVKHLKEGGEEIFVDFEGFSSYFVNSTSYVDLDSLGTRTHQNITKGDGDLLVMFSFQTKAVGNNVELGLRVTVDGVSVGQAEKGHEASEYQIMFWYQILKDADYPAGTYEFALQAKVTLGSVELYGRDTDNAISCFMVKEIT